MIKRLYAKRLLENIKAVYKENEFFEAYINKAFELSRGDPFAISEYFQFFNEDGRKAATLKKRKHERITKEELIMVTQLFTPKYLASYVVTNALSPLLNKISLNEAKELRVLDPAAGTGNLLIIAYQILLDFYVNKHGLAREEAISLIENNLIGIEIDSKAVCIARRIFKQIYNINISIHILEPLSPAAKKILQKYNLDSLSDAIHNFPEFGSLSVFNNDEILSLERIKTDDDTVKSQFSNILSLNHAINQKYDVVLMNPPYLAVSDFSMALQGFVDTYYKEYRDDLFQVFIKRGILWLKENGNLAIICPYNWMFTIKYKNIRQEIIDNHCITNLVMLPFSGIKGAVVYLSAFVINKSILDGKGVYLRLSKSDNQEKELLNPQNFFIFNQSEFKKYPYYALVFWKDSKFRENYSSSKLSDFMVIRQGLATGNNSYFLKKFNEVDPNEICFTAKSIEDFDKSGKKYALYNKGGKYRKWYGNINYVIWFDKEARRLLLKRGNRMPSRAYYFKPCITWTLVSSKFNFGARISDNSVFDVGGSCGFPKRTEDIYLILGYLCSIVAANYLYAQNPTLNCQVGDIKNLPYIPPDKAKAERIEKLVKENIVIAKKDWEGELTVEELKESFSILQNNETELNKIFIGIYGLYDLDPTVNDDLITLITKG